MNTTTLVRKEKTAQLLWTVFVLMFFSIQAVIWMVAISMTAGDKSHTVVAGYDQQAQAWDLVKQQRAASKRLGWNAEVSVANSGDVRGNRIVTIQLTNHTQQPVEGVTITMKAFHRGRAADVQQLSLQETSPGNFSGNVQIRNSGQWQFSGIATQDRNQFLIEKQIKLGSNRNLQR